MTDIANTPPVPAPDEPTDCPRCQKPLALCVCDDLSTINNKIELLVLQHPQEQDKALGTAMLAVLQLKKATLKVGLSWPSLSKILGRTVDPQKWAILYLGSTEAASVAPDRDVVVVDSKGQPVDHQPGILREIEGIVLLDGTWSQAKALWWRNAWMLKCRRVVLGPSAPSRYGKVRKEPRADALSTIEAAGMLLARLEKKPAIEAALADSFERLLGKYREATQAGLVKVPKPVKRDWRGVKRRRR
jgi:DTW domain-containing protein YfiP